MKRRVIFTTVVIILVSFLLTFTAMAADSDGSLLDVARAVGEFISNAVNSIGKFMSNLGTFILNGLKTLFIPKSDYFERAFNRIQQNLSRKFGGILGLVSYLNNAFKNLTQYRNSSGLFTMKFPKSHLFGGLSLNLLSGSEGILSMIRSALSGMVVMLTVAFVYKKVISIVNT